MANALALSGIVRSDIRSSFGTMSGTADGVPLTVTPPNFIIARIVETDPGLKGDTSGGGGKPATLETGAVVRVPLFLNEGEVIRVDTRTGEYVSRAK